MVELQRPKSPGRHCRHNVSYSINFNHFFHRELMLHANTLTGADAYCFKAFAEALEIIPYTLAENAGLNPIGMLKY